MSEKLRVGVVGLGQRGTGLLKDLFLNMPNIEISAVCDVYSDRVDFASGLVRRSCGKTPFCTTDYREIVLQRKADCVLIETSWKTHTEIALFCMREKMPVATEVGGAGSLKECFDLVETQEKTGTPFMFLENCCYGRRELMVLNMVQQNVFGEIVHCAGGYMHDLRDEISFGRERRHYRLDEYLSHNRENYPTHELGPIAKILGINSSNRFVSLTSTSSKARGLHEYILKEKSDDKVLCGADFAQGDIVTTVIRCQNGETITLTLDTTLPRVYSRGLTVRGTKGMYQEDTDSVYLDEMGEHFNQRKFWGNASEFAEKYEHDIWKKYITDGVRGSHDGMDYLVYGEFFDCVRTGRKIPLDVYDAAAWMCITPLSEQSIAAGSAPVEIPDFCAKAKEEKLK